MKKLLFIIILFVFLIACKKEKEPEQIQRTCWECKYRYSGQIPQQVKRYCDGADIGLPTGEISEAQIRQFEKEHYLQGILTVECTSYEEK